MSDAGDDWNARKIVQAANSVVAAAELMERVFSGVVAAIDRLTAAIDAATLTSELARRMQVEPVAASSGAGSTAATATEPATSTASTATPAPAPGSPSSKRTCNRHHDCDEADATFRANHNGSPPPSSFHCHDDECSDCFGD